MFSTIARGAPLNRNVGCQFPAERRITDMSTFTIQHEQEEDGRWIAEVPELPGVLAYGTTPDEAMAKAEVLALRVLADRLEHKEAKPQSISIGVAAA